MKASLLRQGMHVRRKGDPTAPVLAYLRRALRAPCLSELRDPGGRIVEVPDWHMSRKYELCGREG